MKPQQKEIIRQQIENEIATLQTQIAKVEERLHPSDLDCCLDDITRSEVFVEQEVDAKILESFKRHLSQLLIALFRIDSLSFGICIECEEEIAFERMRLRPESVRCVACSR